MPETLVAPDPPAPDDLATPAGPLTETWDSVRRELRGEVSDFDFRLSIEPLEPAAQRGSELVVRAPDRIRSWVRDRYRPLLGRAATRALGREVRVEVVDPDWSANGSGAQPGAPAPGAPPDALNPRYTFERFVICEGSRLAHAAALAVAELPAQAYNPLFVCGPPGLGKTHLLHAIGNYVRRYGEGLSVRYATADTFTTEFVAAARGGEMDAFRRSYRRPDVLLLDDVQFLGGKTRTKEELFHTFNELRESGRQLVLGCDRCPREIAGLEARLSERFSSGLEAELTRPSLSARVAILRKWVSDDGLADLDTPTLAEIARRATGSVRVLEGALIRVAAHASLMAVPASPKLVRSALARFDPPPGPGAAPTLDRLIAVAAEAFQLRPADLRAYDRRPPVTLARQVAMYLSRELTSESLPSIGHAFGGRNHTTVLHAHRRVKRDLAADTKLADAVHTVREHLNHANADRSQ